MFFSVLLLPLFCHFSVSCLFLFAPPCVFFCCFSVPLLALFCFSSVSFMSPPAPPLLFLVFPSSVPLLLLSCSSQTSSLSLLYSRPSSKCPLIAFCKHTKTLGRGLLFSSLRGAPLFFFWSQLLLNLQSEYDDEAQKQSITTIRFQTKSNSNYCLIFQGTGAPFWYKIELERKDEPSSNV